MRLPHPQVFPTFLIHFPIRFLCIPASHQLPGFRPRGKMSPPSPSPSPPEAARGRVRRCLQARARRRRRWRRKRGARRTERPRAREYTGRWKRGGLDGASLAVQATRLWSRREPDAWHARPDRAHPVGGGGDDREDGSRARWLTRSRPSDCTLEGGTAIRRALTPRPPIWMLSRIFTRRFVVSSLLGSLGLSRLARRRLARSCHICIWIRCLSRLCSFPPPAKLGRIVCCALRCRNFFRVPLFFERCLKSRESLYFDYVW